MKHFKSFIIVFIVILLIASITLGVYVLTRKNRTLDSSSKVSFVNSNSTTEDNEDNSNESYPTVGNSKALVRLTLYGGPPTPEVFGYGRSWKFIEQQYIRTGVLQITYRPVHLSVFGPMPAPERNSLVGALCAHQLGKFWEFSEALIPNSNDINDAAQKIGLDPQLWNDCVHDTEIEKAVQQSSLGLEGEGIMGVPAFRMNDEVVNGGAAWEKGMESLFQELERHLHPNDADRWETYRTEKFSIRYPRGWSVVKTGPYTVFDRSERAEAYPSYDGVYRPHHPDAVSIQVFGFSQDRTYADWIATALSSGQYVRQHSNISLGQYTWDRYEAKSANVRDKELLISSVAHIGDKGYVISTSKTSDNMRWYDDIIASFRLEN